MVQQDYAIDQPSNHLAGQTVEALALALFDGTITVHRLPTKVRPLLALAAAYFTAIPLDQRRDADRIGRDMVLMVPIPNLSPVEQAIVASVLAFQRQKVRPHREPTFWRLDRHDQETALALAAMLSLANALSAAPVGGVLVHVSDDTTTVTIHGKQATDVGAAASPCVKRWMAHIGPLVIQSDPSDAWFPASQVDSDADGAQPDALSIPPPLPQITEELAGMPIAEAARQQLRHFFDKLLAREDAVRKGEDIEDVHQMRVATRRLRASLQVVEGVYHPKLIRRYRRGLQQIAGSLGAVRDGDVFLEHVTAYHAALPESDRAQLDPLIAAVSAERVQAREQLLAHLQAKRYRKFKHDFATFLTTPGAGTLDSPEPGIVERVRDFAGSAIWRRYELWRAYEVVLPNAESETLHQARIAGKRFRYTLEFFADALGPHVDQTLAPLIALQETLGALQDVVTARAHIAALGLADDLGAQAYLTTRATEHDSDLAKLPRLWEKVASATYRRRLFEMIVKL